MSSVQNETRWWISPPGLDESLRSVLNRAAALYECTPGELWASLNQDDPEPSGDVDDPSCAAMLRMSRALGVPSMILHSHRSPDAPWRIKPDAGRSFCPECWNADLACGRPRMLRRSWGHVLRTRCSIHGAPLLLAPETWARSSLRPTHSVRNLTPDEDRILDLIEEFGTTLEQSLYFKAPWPATWMSSAFGARSLLVSVSFNLGSTRDFALSRSVYAKGDLSELVYGPRRMLDPLRGPPWDAFRSIGDPAIRRAALWITAWNSIPALPEELSPGISIERPSNRQRVSSR